MSISVEQIKSVLAQYRQALETYRENWPSIKTAATMIQQASALYTCLDEAGAVIENLSAEADSLRQKWNERGDTVQRLMGETERFQRYLDNANAAVKCLESQLSELKAARPIIEAAEARTVKRLQDENESMKAQVTAAYQRAESAERALREARTHDKTRADHYNEKLQEALQEVECLTLERDAFKTKAEGHAVNLKAFEAVNKQNTQHLERIAELEKVKAGQDRHIRKLQQEIDMKTADIESLKKALKEEQRDMAGLRANFSAIQELLTRTGATSGDPVYPSRWAQPDSLSSPVWVKGVDVAKAPAETPKPAPEQKPLVHKLQELRGGTWRERSRYANLTDALTAAYQWGSGPWPSPIESVRVEVDIPQFVGIGGASHTELNSMYHLSFLPRGDGNYSAESHGNAHSVRMLIHDLHERQGHRYEDMRLLLTFTKKKP